MFSIPVPFLIFVTAAVTALAVWLFKSRSKVTSTDIHDLVHQTISRSIPTIIQIAREQLEGEKREIKTDLANKKEAIEKIVEKLEQDIRYRHSELQEVEKERSRQFGEVAKAVEEHRRLTEKLQTSTEGLRQVLSNNQHRGEWGEIAAERILENGGLVEGQHYIKQKQLETTTSRPDFILLLPQGKKVCVDAKFPFSELYEYSQTEDKQTQKVLLAKFETSVKNKIKQITTRGYISEDENTLDYVILFIPSERVFSFINKNFPHVVDRALSKKVVIASPYSFFAIVRTIDQAYRNFYFEQSSKKILKVLEDFVKDYRRFQDEFGQFGENLERLQKTYEKITNVRYKQLDLRFRKIEEYRRGAGETLPEKVDRNAEGIPL